MILKLRGIIWMEIYFWQHEAELTHSQTQVVEIVGKLDKLGQIACPNGNVPGHRNEANMQSMEADQYA